MRRIIDGWRTSPGEAPGYPTEAGSRWVDCVAHIRKNATGEVRHYKHEGIMSPGDTEPHTFNWEHGNYCCDCNRELFWERAGGEETARDIDTMECTDGRFSVNLINPVDNKMFYKEYDEPFTGN